MLLLCKVTYFGIHGSGLFTHASVFFWGSLECLLAKCSVLQLNSKKASYTSHEELLKASSTKPLISVENISYMQGLIPKLINMIHQLCLINAHNSTEGIKVCIFSFKIKAFQISWTEVVQYGGQLMFYFTMSSTWPSPLREGLKGISENHDRVRIYNLLFLYTSEGPGIINPDTSQILHSTISQR